MATITPEGELEEKVAGTGGGSDGNGDGEPEEKVEKQEVDWKTDEEFKKFMGNPSIEAAIKLEKKRADRKLKQLDMESDGNPVTRFFKSIVRDSMWREKERLEKAEQAFKALDLNKVIRHFLLFLCLCFCAFGSGHLNSLFLECHTDRSCS